MNDDMQKALTACLEPVVDAVVAIEKRIDGLTLKEGPQGPQGEPGKDAAPVDVDALAKRLHETLSTCPELVSITTAHIADALKADAAFMQAITGKDGKSVDPGTVATLLSADKAFLQSVTPEPTPVEKVVDALKADLVFLHDVTGKDGERGEQGARGIDGAGIHADAYEPGLVYREDAIVTAFAGQYFQATKDTAEAPGTSDAWQRIGTAGFRFVGIKPEEDEALKQGDLYIDGGSLFHFDGTRARMWVQRGKTGPQGEPGKDGRDGKDGEHAPRVVAVQAHAKGLSVAMDNGEVFDADITGLDDLIAELVERKIAEMLAPLKAAGKKRGGKGESPCVPL